MYEVRVHRHERGLWFRYGDFDGVVGPGTYRLWSRIWSRERDRIEVVNLLDTAFEHELIDILIEDPKLRNELLVTELTETERALLWKDGRLDRILGPGRHAFWRFPYTLYVENFDLASLRFEHAQLEQVLALPETARWLQPIDVPPGQVALLFKDGEFIEELGAGRHVFWRGAGRLQCEVVDLREQSADVAGQEIMTSDKVTLRVNLVVTYRVADASRAVNAVKDYQQALYREAQLVLRAAIGTRILDDLLSDKEAVGGEVRSVLGPRAAELGVEIRSVGLRDIILPGDMKLILNQVITAEKQAQANLIRRREETAAARSQANTAKLLAENPLLARMKELELLQEVLAGSRASFVFGPGDLAEQVRSLVRSDLARDDS